MSLSRVVAVLVGLVSVGVVAVVATAWGASDPLERLFPWIAGHEGAPALSAQAPERLVSVPFGAHRLLTAWAVERTDGAEPCLALRLTDATTGEPPPEAPPAFANIGLSCGVAADPSTREVGVALSWAPASGSPWAVGTTWRVVVVGRVPAGVERLTLASPTGASEVPLARRFFLVVLPGTTASQLEVPERGLALVARGPGGGEVARTALDRFVAEASPPSAATP